jgi:hypothetical protein
MVTVGLLALLRAKAGREMDLASFLEGALPLAQAEPDATAWFAVKVDDSTYGIFDVFPDDTGRQAHGTDRSPRRSWHAPTNCSANPGHQADRRPGGEVPA